MPMATRDPMICMEHFPATPGLALTTYQLTSCHPVYFYDLHLETLHDYGQKHETQNTAKRYARENQPIDATDEVTVEKHVLP